jgi:hypothetical protein
MNRLGDGVKMHQHLIEVAEIQNGLEPHLAELDYETRIVCGEFVEIEKPEYTDVLRAAHAKVKK